MLARTASVGYHVRRATRSLLERWTSVEGVVRTYTGTGSLLVCPYPHWRKRFDKAQLLTEQ